jgi:hypothetical protein
MAKLRKGRRASVSLKPSTVMSGVHFFVKNAQVKYIRPDWDKISQPTVVKVLPAIDDESGKKKFLPYRYDEGLHGFNDWYCPLPTATYIGTNEDCKQSFILFDPMDPDYDEAQNPYIIMFRTLRRLSSTTRLVKVPGVNRQISTAEIAVLMPGRSSDMKSQAFSRPDQRITFLNVIPIYHRDKFAGRQHDGKFYFNGTHEDDVPVIMGLSSSAGVELLKQANIPASEDVDTSDYMNAYHHGDFTSLTDGKLVMLFDTRKFSAETFTAEARTNKSVLSADEALGGADKSNEGFGRYEVVIRDEFVLTHPETRRDVTVSNKHMAKHADAILNNYPPLGELFHVPTHEEIVKYLALAFKDQPYLLYLGGLADFGYLDTDEVKGIINARKQVAATDNRYAGAESLDDLSDDLDDGDDDESFNSKPKTVSSKNTVKSTIEDDEDSLIDWPDDEDDSDGVANAIFASSDEEDEDGPDIKDLLSDMDADEPPAAPKTKKVLKKRKASAGGTFADDIPF